MISTLMLILLYLGSLYCVGDLFCQAIEHHLDENPLKSSTPTFKWDRAFRVASFGFLVMGPFGYYWYRAADKLIPGKTIKDIALKITAELVTFSPVYIPLFFVFQGLYMFPKKEILNCPILENLGPWLKMNLALVDLTALNFIPLELLHVRKTNVV